MNENALERTTPFLRNNKLEDLLNLINSTLSCSEEKLLLNARSLGPKHPVIFIMGPLRSGTTLFTQWLADTGLVSYPSNMLSRFYGAPVIGAQIQQLLTNKQFNFRNEILDFNHHISFESENGKTKGALAPNEFWYFWRRFLPFEDIDYLPNHELFERVDTKTLVNELTALTRVFNKPFALKSMILNYNISFLDNLFDNAIFVQLHRDPITNIASILDARKRQLGSEEHWYSFKIPEYDQLKHLEPISQSAGQLHYINKAINKGMQNIPDSKKVFVQYESFCEDPESIYKELIIKLGANYTEQQPYKGSKSFKNTRTNCQNKNDIKAALVEFD